MDYKKPQSTLVQGGAGIYPLTTADQVILADGSRLEKDGKIRADSAADSAKLGGKAPEYYIQPRNLLDNSDFRNPVNQRGQTSYTGAGYCLDRWRTWVDTDTVSLNDGYVSTTGNGLHQRIELGTLKNTVHTLAALKSDGALLVYAQNPHDEIYFDNSIRIGFGYDVGDICTVKLGEGSYVWAALYEGSYTADTLPPYVPKGYAAELAECQRYYIEIGTQPVNGWCYDWGQVNVFVPTPTLMRQENPSVILNTASPNFYIGSTSYNATLIGGISISNGILVKYSHADTVHGQCIMPEFSAKISADL